MISKDINYTIQRVEVCSTIGEAIKSMHNKGYKTAEISLELLEKIGSVIERQEEIIEDLQERIAIMEEGNKTEC